MEEDLSKPIPTKFDNAELAFIDELDRRTGLGRSAIIRLCVWLLYRDCPEADSPEIHAFLGKLKDERTAGLDRMRKKAKPRTMVDKMIADAKSGLKR